MIRFHLKTLVCGLALCFGWSSVFAIPSIQKKKKANIQVKSKGKKQSIANLKGPVSSISKAEIYASAIRAELIRGIEKTTTYIRSQAAKAKRKSPLRFQFLDKLHDLYVENAVYVRLQEEKRYDQIYRAWEARGAKGSAPKVSYKKSTGIWSKVIATSKGLLKEYPKSKNSARYLFNQGFALSFLGKKTQSARIYSQLVRKYPKAKSAGEAYFNLGEYHFDRSDFRKAIANYKAALRFKSSKRYGWSLFKYAWCQYNLKNYTQALRSWKQVVSISERQGSKGLRLKDEALRDMVYAYAETGDVEGAIAYYRAHGGGKHIAPMLKILSQTLADKGEYSSAIRTAKRLQSVLPYSKEAPGTQKFIIETAADLRKKQLLWQELTTYAKRYGPKSAWASRNAGDRKLVLETQKDIRDQMLYYAKLSHKRAQETGGKPDHLQARKGYQLFMKYYPTARETPEIRYNLADIEYYLKRYRPAGELYMAIAKLPKASAVVRDQNTGKVLQSIHKESAQYMLDAFGKDYDAEFKLLVKRKPDFKKKPLPLSAKAQNYVKACTLYAKIYPADGKTRKVCDLDITQIYYRTGNKPLAKKYLWLVASKYSKTPSGPSAVEQLVPLYDKDKAGLLAVLTKLLTIPVYRQGELGKKLKSLKRETELKAIEAMPNKTAADSGKRAVAWEKYAAQGPREKGADKLWFNAAADYIKAGQTKNALRNYRTVVKNYPKSSQQKPSLLQLITLHEKRFEYSAAMSYMGDLVNKYPKAPEAKAAVAKRCEYSVALGESAAYKKCSRVEAFDPASAAFFYDRMVVNSYRSGSTQALSDFTRVLGAKKTVPTNLKIKSNYFLMKLSGASVGGANANRVVAEFNRNSKNVNGEALRYVGEVLYKRAAPVARSSLGKGLAGGTVPKMLSSIQAKQGAIDRAEKAFGPLFKSRDAFWVSQADFQLGQAYEDFARRLENPPPITGAELADVKKQLAPQAQGMKQKAAKLYQQIIQNGQKYGVASDVILKSRVALAKISGKSLAQDLFVPVPDFVGGYISEELARRVQ